MTMKDALAAKLIEKLDTAGTLRGEVFQVAVDINVAKNGYKYFTQPTFNTQELVEFIPASMDFQDTPRNIPDLDKTEWSIVMNFALQGLHDNDENLINEKYAIDTFRAIMISTPTDSFTFNGETYEFVMTPSSLTRIGAIQVDDGSNRIVMAMSIAIISGKGLVFGNDERVKISSSGNFTDSELYPITKVSGMAIEEYSDQASTDTKAFSVPQRNLWQMQMQIVFDKNSAAHQYLYDHVQGLGDFEELFTVKMYKPYSSIATFSKSCTLQGQSIGDMGVDLRLVLTVTEAE